MIMAKEAPQFGHKITGTVKSVKGECTLGYKEGDKFELSCHKTGGLCGFLYHECFPWMMMLQFGGEFPVPGDKDAIEVECPHREVAVKLELRRVK